MHHSRYIGNDFWGEELKVSCGKESNMDYLLQYAEYHGVRLSLQIVDAKNIWTYALTGRRLNGHRKFEKNVEKLLVVAKIEVVFGTLEQLFQVTSPEICRKPFSIWMRKIFALYHTRLEAQLNIEKIGWANSSIPTLRIFSHITILK